MLGCICSHPELNAACQAQVRHPWAYWSCSLHLLHDPFIDYLLSNTYWEIKIRQWYYLYLKELMISATKREVTANVTTGRICTAVIGKQRGRRTVSWVPGPQTLIIWDKWDTSSFYLSIFYHAKRPKHVSNIKTQ